VKARSLGLRSSRSLLSQGAGLVPRFVGSGGSSENDQRMLVQFKALIYTESETNLSSQTVGSWARAGRSGGANDLAVCARSYRGAGDEKGKDPGKGT